MADSSAFDQFVGTWQTNECEGFKEFLKAIGVGMVKRNLASSMGAGEGMKIDIVKTGEDSGTLQLLNPKVGALNPISLAGETEITTGQGHKGACTTTLNGNTLKMEVTLKDGGLAGKTQVVERVVEGDNMTMTVYFTHVADVKCVRKQTRA